MTVYFTETSLFLKGYRQNACVFMAVMKSLMLIFFFLFSSKFTPPK